jgi:alkylation response protein AidB-like acyl-CoA dehydrogenase
LHGKANGFRLDRLKDKLGTRSLPTGEMTLAGSLAWTVGDLDAGLSNMVRIVLTTSRFWNALAAASFVRGAERIAHAYANFRRAFGRPISEFPLTAEALERLSQDRRRLTAAAFAVLSAWEGVASVEREGRMPDAVKAGRSRVLVMLAKTCATRRATQRVHDAMMILAGNGIEERFSALPRLWRDAAILETWEGPHGLLVERCWLEISRRGAKDDPIAATALLLGPGADAGVVEHLGRGLRDAFGGVDERTRLVRFDHWCQQFYDAFGDQAWALASRR